MPDRDPDCVFCRIVAGELPARVVDEDEQTLAFLDMNPGAPGHTLVVPKAHTQDIRTVGPDDLLATYRTAQRVADRIVDRLGATGVNVLSNCGADAWQTVFHLHVHVIPRTAGDPIVLPWTPTPGDPDAIAATHATLTAA